MDDEQGETLFNFPSQCPAKTRQSTKKTKIPRNGVELQSLAMKKKQLKELWDNACF